MNVTKSLACTSGKIILQEKEILFKEPKKTKTFRPPLGNKDEQLELLVFSV